LNDDALAEAKRNPYASQNERAIKCRNEVNAQYLRGKTHGRIREVDGRIGTVATTCDFASMRSFQ